MFVEEIVQVVIGLIFIWIALSVAVYQIQEWFAAWLSIRADSLEDSIRGLLDEPKRPKGILSRMWEQGPKLAYRWRCKLYYRRGKRPDDTCPVSPYPLNGYAKAFYAHPLIKALAQESKLPSYIPKEKFASVIFDIVMTAGTDRSLVQQSLQDVKRAAAALTDKDVADRATADLAALQAAVGQPVGEVNPSVMLRHLRHNLEHLQEDYPQLAEATRDLSQMVARKRPWQQLRSGIDTLQHDEHPYAQNLGNMLDDLYEQTKAMPLIVEEAAAGVDTHLLLAETRLRQMRENTEAWFNDTMDRSSGWYKRNRQAWAAVIAIILAIILNVDSAHIAQRMWTEPLLRDTLASAALESVAAGDPLQDVETGFDVPQIEESLSALQIPIGWDFQKRTPFDPAAERCRLFAANGGIWINGSCWYTEQVNNWSDVLVKVVGIAITAGAAMQGAPFWFEILTKIVGVRSAGKKPD